MENKILKMLTDFLFLVFKPGVVVVGVVVVGVVVLGVVVLGGVVLSAGSHSGTVDLSTHKADVGLVGVAL